jgi:hypothetical protein
MQVKNIDFISSLKYVCNLCNISCDIKTTTKKSNIDNWQELKKFTKKGKEHSSIKAYDDSILQFFPKLYHQSFIDDNISIKTMEKYGLRYYPYKQQVIIPVYQNGKLVGIQSRNLNPEIIKLGYKYIPLSTLSGDEYKFSTSKIMYGYDYNKENIIKQKSVIIVESAKSVMQLEEILDKNIGIGLFGLNCSITKRDMLLKCGIENVYIAVDKDYNSIYDENGNETKEFIKYKKVVMKIAYLFKPFCEVYIIYDDSDLLKLHNSPTDCGKIVWDKLFENKIKL